MLESLAAVHEQPGDPATTALLRKALRGRSSHAAAKAAEIAAELAIDAVVEDMREAFDRFMVKPVQSDPGCAAKEAIVDALQQMGVAAGELYAKGIAHRQMEPVWGGRVDTAARLRGLCGIGFARIRDERTLAELAVLLADPEPEARRMAAQALAYNADPAAVPLLRYKSLVGDEDGEVLMEAMRALLELDPSRSVDFIANFLREERGEMAEAAALALGASRSEEAFVILRDWWKRASEPSLKGSAALALAMLRRETSIDYLVEILGGDSVLDARHVLAALAIYRHDGQLRERVESVVREGGNASLRKEFDRTFGAP